MTTDYDTSGAVTDCDFPALPFVSEPYFWVPSKPESIYEIWNE